MVEFAQGGRRHAGVVAKPREGGNFSEALLLEVDARGWTDTRMFATL